MKYLLDTNVIAIYINRRVLKLRTKLDSTPVDELGVCSIVKAELFTGSLKSNQAESIRQLQQALIDRYLSLPFDDHAAEYYARIRIDLERKGTPIGSNDLMIAAIAVANDLTLITHNTAEFGRVAGLQHDDWEA